MAESDFKTLLETSDPGEVAFVKSLLDSCGMIYLVVGETDQKILQSSMIKIRVESRRFEEARQLILGLHE
ncbi:MAG TPA: hypothetical protein DCL35_03465 [Candidatus Omnitrophica bacterium]|nr:hypothetical protein [Candidatus Omnitrophota bacterium]